jgi:hypothetical protein
MSQQARRVASATIELCVRGSTVRRGGRKTYWLAIFRALKNPAELSPRRPADAAEDV